MQTATPALSNLLLSSNSIRTRPRVRAEWNHNRYSPIAYKDNSSKPEATYGFDLEMYPFDSIVASPRPTKGLMKARTDQRVPVVSYNDIPPATRVYTVDYDAKYKYWMSPERTDNYFMDAAHTTLRMQNCTPTIIHQNLVQTNKIYVCFENGWAHPNMYTVQVTTNGSTWTTVATNAHVDSKGRVQLYRQADGSWTTTVNYDNPVQLKGVRLSVTGLDRMYARLSLIEMGLRLERDLSAYLTGYGIENSLGDDDFVSPMGIMSSNTASVTLSNLDGTFTDDNPASLYYGLMDANVLFTIDLGIEATPGNWEYIRQATMYSEAWEGGDEDVNIALKDASKFLQEINPNRLLMESVTIGKAIWRILDSVGFNNYNYTRSIEDGPSVINYYWTDSDKTVWANIQEICRTTQTAVYFDEFGVLQIKTRRAAFNRSAPVSWTLDGANRVGHLADIISLNQSSIFEANTVNIGYQKTQLSQNEEGEPIQEVLWQPGNGVRGPDGKVIPSESETVVLRAGGLRDSMNSTQMHFYLAANQADYWPYQGIVNIRGELVRYSGKQYAWYDNAGGRHYDWLYSIDDKIRIDKEVSGSYYRNYNFFTGAFQIIERGYDVTEPQDHDVTIQRWINNGAFYGHHTGPQTHWTGGLVHVRHLSSLRLQTNSNFGGNMWYAAHRNVAGAPVQHFGTRMRFPSNPKGPHQSAGLFFYGNDGNIQNMYCVNISSTAHIEKYDQRMTAHEVRFLARKNSGIQTFPCVVGNADNTQAAKGMVMYIRDDQWVDIDVHVMSATNFVVYIDGKIAFNVNDPAPLPASVRSGVFIRGNGVADFEYYYAVGKGARLGSGIDESDFLDIVERGYYSDQYYKDVMYQTRNVKKKRGKKTVTVKQNYAQRIMDEFGVVVHEVREYDVNFEKVPAISSQLYYSNSRQAVVDEYTHSAFGAKFTIANAARSNAVVNGGDDGIYLGDTVNQQMMITGRTVQQNEEKLYTVKNEQAIRARGEIVLDISSNWIQHEGAARELGDWIIQNWSDPNDVVSVDMFGNPLIQLGDVIAVNYARQNMTANTHKYFVTGITNGWDNGPTTSLTLRRARI